MSADTSDYTLPTSRPPVAANTAPETERQRLERRAFREELEREQAEADAPRIAAERKTTERIAELQSEQETTLRQLHTIERERVATGSDEAFQIDPATVGESAAVPVAELDAWHAAQSTEFLASNPQYLRCPENQQAILSYIERNAPGLKLLSAKQMTAAYRRLRDLGLLKERPAPVQPTPPTVERRTEMKPSPKPANPLDEVVDGWEIDGSAPRRWTQRELDRLSSTDYRKALRLYKADLQITNLGPTARKHEPYAS